MRRSGRHTPRFLVDTNVFVSAIKAPGKALELAMELMERGHGLVTGLPSRPHGPSPSARATFLCRTTMRSTAGAMEKVKVTRKYQVTIPKDVRERLGVRVGDELVVRGAEGRIVFEKSADLGGMAGSWSHIESTEEFMESARELWRTWTSRR